MKGEFPAHWGMKRRRDRDLAVLGVRSEIANLA
jgi:hypothetical protein